MDKDQKPCSPEPEPFRIYPHIKSFLIIEARKEIHSVHPSNVAKQLLVENFPAATKNCWRRCFLCGPCRIKGNWRLVLPRTSSSSLWDHLSIFVSVYPLQLFFLCVVHLISKESRRLILLRTTFCKMLPPPAQPRRWRTTPCQFTPQRIQYSVFEPDLPIWRPSRPSAMPWWQGTQLRSVVV
jgi:hypothetical protein